MSRVQLALNVDDLVAAIAHYTKVFGVAPAKVRPGYANFSIADPPLKLVLMENPGAVDSVNHLGVEFGSVDEVRATHDRIVGAGLPTFVEGETTCCYSVQDKFWIQGGDHPFETYTVLADAETMTAATQAPAAEESRVEACCLPAAQEVNLAHRGSADCC